MDKIELNILKEIAGLHKIPEGAYNIRVNGQAEARNSSANVEIVQKTDKPGIDIIIKPNTKNESVHIPVILSKSGITESVYNDFYIGENADVVIVAGCGIHNCGTEVSRHDGIHAFHVGKNAKILYVEKHYGEGTGESNNVMNPTTEITLEEGAHMEMQTTQIKGIASTVRVTKATAGAGATLLVRENIMTHGNQFAETDFTVDLNGEGASADIVSRSVAKENSRQNFLSRMNGNAPCHGHTECDAILMDNAVVSAIPELTAANVDAELVHEAAIGKIAGEQLTKLMTLGLTEKEAEEVIVSGFLK
ncbi:MAG: SufD family Fe-S cluster assembly protein [Clostridiales bacterium]|nr:SufD family Fe-S cluster assembly protein [Clostridiales bacterium]